MTPAVDKELADLTAVGVYLGATQAQAASMAWIVIGEVLAHELTREHCRRRLTEMLIPILPRREEAPPPK